jgi:hypothetical protein
MFTQIMNRFQQIGQWGSSQLNFENDWVTPLSENVDQFSSTPTTNGVWTADTNTCTHVADLELQILYSKIGFFDRPQKYIVAAKKRGAYNTWSFTSPAGTT